MQLAKVEYQSHPPLKSPYAGSTVLVEKGNGGFNNHHVLFVGVPWNVTKAGAPTDVVLRRVGDEIDVVDVR